MLEHNIFISFVVIFLITFVNFQQKTRFFVLVIVFIIFIIYNRNTQKPNNNINTYISNIEKELPRETEIPEDKIFSIHKIPTNIQFIKKNIQIQKLLYDIRFLKIYDRPLYDKIISYIEYFFKIHYMIMTGKYNSNLYFSTLKDIRHELLNTMKTIVFNVPVIDDVLEKTLESIRAITFRYMRMLYHKYPTSHMFYKAPFELDNQKNNLYHIF